MTKHTQEIIDTMCEDKPQRYKQMVVDAVDKADSYMNMAGGSLVSRQVIAAIMLMVDSMYAVTK